MKNVLRMAGVVLVASSIYLSAGAQTTILDDPADLPHIEQLLKTNSHALTTSFIDDVGRFVGTVKLPHGTNDIVYVISFDGQGMQMFCGHSKQDVSSIQPGEAVHLAGKVLVGNSIFVLQVCDLERATPHQKEIAGGIRGK